MGDFRDLPIPDLVLPWTNRPDGDDTGYRDVKVAPEDETEPDPLVLLLESDDDVECYSVYANGSYRRICPYYFGGLGADERVLIRTPASQALRAASAVLRTYSRKPLVVDGFRDCSTQAKLFSYLFRRLLGGRDPASLSVTEFVHFGRRADDVGSYAAVKRDDAFSAAQAALLDGQMADQVAAAAFDLQVTRGEVARLYLTFGANLGLQPTLTLDPSAPTAHGSGGALDILLVDAKTSDLTLLGVPFDYCRPGDDRHPTGPAAMRYFEDEGNLDHYAKLVERDPVLEQFVIRDFDVEGITIEVFRQIQRERRLFFHAMQRAGFSFFNGECWHFNAPNQFDSNQFAEYPFGGNACHSLLQNVCGDDGKPVAVWGNTAAHKMAAELLKRK